MSNKSTQFKPGQSGNPDGRPKKGYSITEWFQSMLASSPEVKDAIGKSIVKKAVDGDVGAQKLVWSYMDGMPVNTLVGKDGEAIRIIIEDYGNTNNSTAETTGVDQSK